MATGSGKTLLMAANILHLYTLGYRNFIFFVNSANVIRKTKANFLDITSSKYLFNSKIIYNDKQIYIEEVQNFEGTNDSNINIVFSTIQGLHSRINTPQENSITKEDFSDKKVVFLSDEAHHINALTKAQSKLTQEQKLELTSWEGTINDIFNRNRDNIMLEYTATIDLSVQGIYEKYKNKILFQYALKEFREDKYSKDIQIIKSNLELLDRALQAVILSQYKRKIAERNKIFLKPVILIKSQKTIAQSEEAESSFHLLIDKLNVNDIKRIRDSNPEGIIKKAFDFFENEKISLHNLVKEIKVDFAIEKCISVNSKSESEEKQILVNTLEDISNEIRVIFTVNMLNEGWDVLNLFDIVRLYEKRDSRHKKIGATTISEAQLIGRGARYFPFIVSEEQEKYKRKYDNFINNELRVLEQLHYHSLNDSRYINEIKTELIRTGIAPPDSSRREITINVKKEILNSKFWKSGLIFLNQRIKNSRNEINSLKDLISNTTFVYSFIRANTSEESVFGSNESVQEGIGVSNYKIKFTAIEKHIARKALDKEEFYRFSNLVKYFPNLISIDEFLTSNNYGEQIVIEIKGTYGKINALSNLDKFKIALDILKQVKNVIENSTTEFIGTKEFLPNKINLIFEQSKTSDLLVRGEDSEYGISMSMTNDHNLRLNLKEIDWFIYDDNYGTSEEKYFIRFIKNNIDVLKKKYSNIYLLRNEGFFKVYNFSNGKPLEPDFILYLNNENPNKNIYYQIFIEPKGQFLYEQDKWKESFLVSLKKEAKVNQLWKGKNYIIWGMPFYNKNFESDFADYFTGELI